MTEPTMVDRVATSIQDGLLKAEWNPLTLARAAIAAMLQPTQAMVEAAVAHGDIDYRESWQVMIDAAIKEAGHD